MHIQGSSITGTLNFFVSNYMLSGKKKKAERREDVEVTTQGL